MKLLSMTAETPASREASWCMIPVSVLRRKDLSSSEKVLIGQIVWLVKTEGRCTASNAQLGAQLKLTRHSISRLVNGLARKRLLEVAVMRDESGQVTERLIGLAAALRMEVGGNGQ